MVPLGVFCCHTASAGFPSLQGRTYVMESAVVYVCAPVKMESEMILDNRLICEVVLFIHGFR